MIEFYIPKGRGVTMKQKIEAIKKFVIKNIKWLIVFIGVIIFLAIVEDIFDKEIVKLDAWGYQFIAGFLISDFATPIAKIITRLGGATILITTTIVFLVMIKNKKLKWGLIVLLSILVIAIGISRIYLGVHDTSDVLAGFTISISYLVAYTSISKRWLQKGEKENEKNNV